MNAMNSRTPPLLWSGLTLGLLALGLWLHLHAPFRERLSDFSTSLSERTPAQRHNIRLAARALDGAVIEPGALFSFNAAVGPRTLARGYRRAEALMEGEMVSSIGGGICQVSSTLYNAALLAAFQVVRRAPHLHAVRSVPPGRDATVWYGKTDLVVRNSRPHPVRLGVQVQGERMVTEVWGTRQPGEAVEVAVQVLDRLPPPLRYTYDVRVFRGRRAILEAGSPGYHVRTVRRSAGLGPLPRQEILSQDFYRPRPRLIRIGTG